MYSNVHATLKPINKFVVFVHRILVQPQNGCGESSFGKRFCVIPVGLTYVNCYAPKSISIENKWCYHYHNSHWPVWVHISTWHVWINTMQREPNNNRLAKIYHRMDIIFLPWYFVLIIYMCHRTCIEKKYEFLLESSFNSSKLQEITNDIENNSENSRAVF